MTWQSLTAQNSHPLSWQKMALILSYQVKVILKTFSIYIEDIFSDSLFSLIIFIYVSVTFLYIFYAFCWRTEVHKPMPDNRVGSSWILLHLLQKYLILGLTHDNWNAGCCGSKGYWKERRSLISNPLFKNSHYKNKTQRILIYNILVG